jgi:hypothetical protein
VKIENIEVFGFMAALRGMRNALESWDKSDSDFYSYADDYLDPSISAPEAPFIGPNDLTLACKLIKAGRSHRKFLRQIQIWWDITIPRAIWQELDTYKIATVRNSCSTMHKLGSRDLELSDFQNEMIEQNTLDLLNGLGKKYRESSPKLPSDLHKIKMYLPESFLQKATYSFNYETALTMYFDRCNHRMPEWSGANGICETLMKLPYFKDFYEAGVQKK